MPISAEDQKAFTSLLKGGKDYLKGFSSEEREAILRRTSYLDFLKTLPNNLNLCGAFFRILGSLSWGLVGRLSLRGKQ